MKNGERVFSKEYLKNLKAKEYDLKEVMTEEDFSELRDPKNCLDESKIAKYYMSEEELKAVNELIELNKNR